MFKFTSILLGPLPFLTLAPNRVQDLCWWISILFLLSSSPSLSSISSEPISTLSSLSLSLLHNLRWCPWISSFPPASTAMNFSPLSVSYFPRLPAVNIIFWKKELFSCLSTESQRDPQRYIPSFQSRGSRHLQSEQGERMTKSRTMKFATWMKSVVRDASAA